MGAVAVWGDFEVHLDQLLGRGGMGSVYRARQKSLGRWVAVKVLDTAPNLDPLLAQGFLQKFKVEIAALAKLNDPRIVSIIQAGENEGRCWFAMELLEGRTLEARLGDVDLLSEAEARRLGAEIARGLGAAWRAGIVHRDVKPGNIFLLKDGALKIADFGLARSEALGRTRLTDAGAFACTPAYASPEQIEGKSTDHRADIYSLGCVLYEMLTQRPPFLADSHLETLSKHKFQAPVSILALNPAVSPDYEEIVLRCLEKQPDDRWGTYEDLVDALSRPKPRVPAPMSPSSPSAAPSRSGRRLAAMAVAGLAILAWLLVTIFSTEVPAKPDLVVAPAPEPLLPPLPKAPEPAPAVAPAPPPVLEKPAPHRASAEELAYLERLFAASRATLEERSGYVFAGAEARLREIEREPHAGAWAKERATAELERILSAAKAFPPGPLFKAGVETTVLLRDGRTLRGRVLDETAATARLELEDGRRLSLPRTSIAPATFPAGRVPMTRAGAGDAAGVLGDLGEPHATGLLDQAIEEAFRAADGGDFRPLRALKPTKAQRESTEPVLPARLRLLDEERAAAELREKGMLTDLLLEKPLSRAARRGASEALEAFLRSLPEDGDAELVGEVPWGTWEPDTFQAPGGSARLEAGTRAYVLSAPRPGQAVWIKKPFEGARRGYRVNFRFPSPEDAPALAVALTFHRWIEIGPDGVLLKGVEEGRPARTLKRVEPGRRIDGGRLVVAPVDGLTLVWLDEGLLFALPAPEYAPEAGMQLGGVGGSVRIESIRVKDRSR